MSTLTMIRLRRPQLLLRVLGTDADRRLVLLIFAILSASLYIFFVEFVSLFLPQLPFLRCAAQSLSAPEMLTVGGLNFSCGWQFYVQMLLWLLLGLFLVLGLAFLIYWLFPNWKCWREGLQPLKGAEFVEAVNYIEKLRKEEGLKETRLASIHLRYVRNPSLIEGTPQVFGSLGRSFLSLPSEWIQLFVNERKSGNVQNNVFRGVILHELSHLQNKDVGRYYVAKSILYSFILLALAPFLVFMACAIFLFPSVYLPNAIFASTTLCIGLIFSLVEVPAIYCAILRSREVYADIQAVQWGNSPEMMEKAFNLLASENAEKKPIWQRLPLFSTHPSLEERKRNIDDQSRVFRLKPLEALGIGVVFGFALPPVYYLFSLMSQLLTDWLLKMSYPEGLPDPGILLLCLFLAFIVGQMIWRAKIAVGVQSKELHGAGRFGLCLAVGLMFGCFISIPSLPFFIYIHTDWQVILFYILPWVMLLALGCYGFCKWLALVASHWLEVVNTERGFRLVSRVSFVVAGLLLSVGLELFLFLFLVTFHYLLQPNLHSAIISLTILFQPLADITFYWRFVTNAFSLELLPMSYTLLALVSLWVFPLLSWFWYRRKISKSRFQWALADSTDDPAPTVPQKPFHLRSVGLIALIGSLVFCLLLLAIRLKSGEPATPGGSMGPAMLIGPFLLPVFIGPFILAALFQAGLATVIVRRTRMINGLFGAFLGGCVMVIGTIAIYSVFGGIGFGGPGGIFVAEVGWGTVCALGVLTLIGVWRSLARIQQKQRLLIAIPCILLVGAVTLFPLSVTWADNQSHAMTNSVKDGDFESPVVLVDSSIDYQAGQSLGAWTVASGSVDLVNTDWVPAHGAQSVDLNAGSIYQDVSTPAGASYFLSFAMAGNLVCAEPAVKQMQVLWGSTLVDTVSFNTNGYHWYDPGWQYHIYKNLSATGDVTRLSFKSVAPSWCGPALDDVTVGFCASRGCSNIPLPNTAATSTGAPNPTATGTPSPNTTAATGTPSPNTTATTGTPLPTSAAGGTVAPTPTPAAGGTVAPTPTPTPAVVGTPNPYAPYMSNLIMDDPLVDNSRGYQWDEQSAGGASCGFAGGAYDVKATAPGGIVCVPEASNLFVSNLTYQISLKVTQGEWGGIVFRFDQNNVTGYVFFVDVKQGTYTLSGFNGSGTPSVILTGPSSAINQGLNQFNVLAVVANGSAISLYVNGQSVAQTNNSAYSQGQMGIFTADTQDPAEVQANNARAWTV